MPSEKAPRRLQDIIDNAQAIFIYIEGMDLAAFEEDRRTYDAVERCLERISEAAAKLGDLAPVLMPGQPWQKIRAFGNVLRHEYDVIREDMLFEIATKDLVGLCAAATEPCGSGIYTNYLRDARRARRKLPQWAEAEAA